MLERGIGKGPYATKLRPTAWLLVGVMLYAGALGHLLHPWLHEHLPQHHNYHQAVGNSPGHHLHVPVVGDAHLPCAFCAFLATYLAQAPTPPPRLESRPISLGKPFACGEGLFSAANHRLPNSRSPPFASVC